jgi:hypothetical protein
MLAISSVGSQLLLLLLGRVAVGRALQELEDLLHGVTGRGFRLATTAQDLPLPPDPEHQRDLFEQNVTADDTKSLLYFGGTLAAPSTAFMYDGLGIMPLGQQLWLKELQSYEKFPPLQSPSSYNLSEVMDEVRKAHNSAPSD